MGGFVNLGFKYCVGFNWQLVDLVVGVCLFVNMVSHTLLRFVLDYLVKCV